MLAICSQETLGGVEQHQPLDHPAERCGLPVAVMRLTNDLVQGLELDIRSILSDSKTGVPASAESARATRAD